MACKDILISMDQIDALDNDWLTINKEKEPDSNAEKQDPPADAQSSAMTLTQEEIVKRKKLDKKVCSTICLCLTHNVIYNFADETTTCGI